MKTKTSKLIILMIALFAVMLIGTTKVNATTTENEKIEKLIPDTITLDIPEVECEKGGNLLQKEIEETLKKENIDITKYEISTGIYLDWTSDKNKFYEAYVTITGENNFRVNKEVSIKYNNTDKRSSKDEQYVKNLKIESPKYYEVDLEFIKDRTSEEFWDKFFNLAEKYYTNLVGDNSIVIKAYANSADGTTFNNFAGHDGTYIMIFKNGVFYEKRVIGIEYSVPVITVPSTIAEDKINEYVMNVIKPYYKEEGTISLVKGTKELGANIPDGYTVNYNGKAESYIIVRQEKPTTNTSAVTKTDSTTNVKLNAPVGTVPSNTVLEVKTVKEGTTYNTVKNALATMKNFAVYDITLKSNGVTVQPNGNVRISVPVPEGYNKENLTVYRIEDNGNKTEYKVTVEGDYATFETNHFSTYVLAEKKAETKPATSTPATTNKGEKDNTPKTGTVESITYIIPVMIISALGVVAFRKKETK